MRKTRIWYVADCQRLQRIALEHLTIELTLTECQELWKDVSDSYCASWLVLPEDDNAVATSLSEYITVRSS